MVSREGPLVPSLKGTRRARLVGCMAPDPYSQAVHRRTVGPASTSQHGDPAKLQTRRRVHSTEARTGHVSARWDMVARAGSDR
jgi:hypothetical protein